MMLYRRLPLFHLALAIASLSFNSACTKSTRPAIEASQELPGEVELPENESESSPATFRDFTAKVSVVFPEGASIGQDERVLALKCEPAVSIKAQKSRSDLAQLRVDFELILQTYAELTTCSKLIVGDSLDLYFDAAIQQELTIGSDGSGANLTIDGIVLASNDKIEAEKAKLMQEEEQQRAQLEEEAAYAQEIANDIASRQAEIELLQDELQSERAKALQAQKEATEQLLERVKELERRNQIIAEKNQEIDELQDQLNAERQRDAERQLGSERRLDIGRDKDSSRLSRDADTETTLIELKDERLTRIYFESCKDDELFDVNTGTCQPI